jgi:hypothetical protein
MIHVVKKKRLIETCTYFIRKALFHPNPKLYKYYIINILTNIIQGLRKSVDYIGVRWVLFD